MSESSTQEIDISKVPEKLEYWSVDEVAECLDGISSEVYTELWGALEAAHKAGKAKPLGGDGSGGTIEEPVITSGEYDSDLAAAWPRLSENARLQIHKAAAGSPDLP